MSLPSAKATFYGVLLVIVPQALLALIWYVWIHHDHAEAPFEVFNVSWNLLGQIL